MKQLVELKQALTDLKPELSRRFHVATLGLFGSVVRNDFSHNSDIDIIFEFNQPIGIEFITLADFIESHLRKKVDLVSRHGIKDKYFKAIEREIIYV